MARVVIISIVGVVLLVIVVTVWRRSRNSGALSDVGFREYVRHPEVRSAMAEVGAARDEAVARLARKPPEKLVRQLLKDDAYDLAKLALCSIGPEVVPALISALGDPAYRRSMDESANESMHILLRRSEPLVTVLECLQHYAPDAGVVPVSALVEDENVEIRKEGALLLGSIGSGSAVAPLRRSLADEDEYVRSSAMNGIQRALAAGRCREGFRAGMFDAIVPLVWRSDCDDAPRCLLELDRERAIKLLTTTEGLSPGREGLKDVLGALRGAHVCVDQRQLLAIIAELEGSKLEYPDNYVLGEALRLLAPSASETARAAIARGMNSPSKRVREDASEALAASHGIDDPFGAAFDRLDDVGWGGLTEPQRNVLAVRILIDEVNNGGFSQYFVNSSGDNWRDALNGLAALGAESDYELMRRAVDLFGSVEPSAERDERHRQLAKVVEDDDDVFFALEEVFYQDQGDREVILLRYIIAHSSHFRAP